MENKTEFIAKDGLTYEIGLEEDLDVRVVVFRSGVEIGSISLESRDEDQTYHVMNLSLENCKRLGIGQRCLEFFNEVYQFSTLTAEESHGQKREDGSHLIGDGPGFVAAMREKKIIAATVDSRSFEDRSQSDED
ncbi:MAG: hypothetical protein V4542_08130 [Pseudomonadota bacterium]